MTKRVQRVRHNSTQAAQFIGLIGEITIDTTNKIGIVHDGATPGGIPMARQDLENVAVASPSRAGKMTAEQAIELAKIPTIETNIAGNTSAINSIISTHTPTAQIPVVFAEYFSRAKFYTDDVAGTGQDIVATIPATGLTLHKGLMVMIKSVSACTGPDATLNLNGLGQKGIVLFNGRPTYQEAIDENGFYLFVYGGSQWRLINPSHYVSQEQYDRENVIGEATRLLAGVNPPLVPRSCVATWTRYDNDRYLRIAPVSEPPTQGGENITSSNGAHTHTVDPHAGAQHAAGPNGPNAADQNITTSSAGAHTHTVEPEYQSFSMWLRTA